MDEIDFPYQAPQQVRPDVWVINGEWKNKFARRMTILRTPAGGLIVHSAMKLKAADLDWLRQLGPVQFVVAPNKFHVSDFPWMAKHFPEAKLIAPASRAKRFAEQGLSLWRTTADEFVFAGSEIKHLPVRGLNIEESALFEPRSRTLVVCDLVFNMPAVFTGLEAWLMSLNRIGGRLGPSRLARVLFTKNRRELLATVRSLADLDPAVIVPNHGEVEDAKTGSLKIPLLSSFREIYGEF